MAGELAKLGGDLRRLASQVGSSRLVTAAAVAGKKSALDTLRRDLPSGRLRNLGRAGSSLSVGYDITGDTTADVNLRPAGAWSLLDKGAKAHQIGARRKRGRGHGRPLLKIDGRVVTGPIPHPGARGHQTLTKAYRVMEKDVTKAIRAELFDMEL